MFKLLLAEPGADQMRTLRPQITLLASVRIAYVELRAGLAAAARDGRLGAAELKRAKHLLRAIWNNVSPLEIDEELATAAGELAERHALRGYDAVHLAGLARLAPPGEATFACWDVTLRSAAAALGYESFPQAV